MEIKKFTAKDRKRVIERLQEVQNVRLTLRDGKRLFCDEAGKCYFVLGGSGMWHGIHTPILSGLLEAGDGMLVIAKKYQTYIDVCVGPLGDFISRIHPLPGAGDGTVHLHLVNEGDGMSIEEMPGFFLNTAFNIPLTGASPHEERQRKVGRIVNMQVQEPETVSHADAQAKLILIGGYLGYRTYTPDRAKKSVYGALGDLCSEQSVPDEYLAKQKIDEICNIDVIWFSDDGLPTHGFEVEHSTDVTKGLLRLYQASGLSMKMFIVAQEKMRGRFERERDKAPFRKIRARYIFNNYRELDALFESVKASSNLRKQFMKETD